MAEVKRVNLLDQQHEMMGRGPENRRGAGAASLKKIMSIESFDKPEPEPNDDMAEGKKVNLLNQQQEIVGRGPEDRRGAGAASLKEIMSIESLDKAELNKAVLEPVTAYENI